MRPISRVDLLVSVKPSGHASLRHVSEFLPGEVQDERSEKAFHWESVLFWVTNRPHHVYV